LGSWGFMGFKTNIGLFTRPPILDATFRMEELFVAFPTGMRIIVLSTSVHKFGYAWGIADI
jgi:hypothetical protein